MTPRLPPVVPSTTLRVYEPLEAFSVEDRPALEVLALRPGADDLADEAERAASWCTVLTGQGAVVTQGGDGTPPHAGWGEEDARPPRRRRRTGRSGQEPPADAQAGATYPATRVLRAGGVLLVCPVGGPEEVGGPGSRRPPRRLVRVWTLPEAWLTLVRPEDGERAGGAGRYHVPMSTARSRAARALRTLRLGIGDTELTAEVEIMARWLETFHPRSWVVLDASGIVPLTGGEDGAEDVRLGLECLASGDTTGAAAAYHRLTTRQRLLDDFSRSS